MLKLIENGLLRFGVNASLAAPLAKLTALGLVILAGGISYIVVKRIVINAFSQVIKRTKNTWDDAFLRRGVLHRLVYFVPVLFIYHLVPIALAGTGRLIAFSTSVLHVCLIFIIVLVIDSVLNALVDIYNTFPVSREIPIRGFVQTLKIITVFISAIFIISILLNRTPIFLLSGLGALTAVLLFIFKDPILGFVAGVQLTANRMLAQGDWIEMPKYGADGEVLDINLTTVKVQNWDKTITTIPTYALISDSFKNWRGMREAASRRIKRSIFIDINTIKFCTEEMLEQFSKIRYISAYIAQKKKEVSEHNARHQLDDGNLLNARRLTNIGTFRAYVTAYLRNHPLINQEMTFLVRQLAPSEYGLPIEIYGFCRETALVNYEAVQADIFDHIFAIIPEFDLRVFQSPTGNDFSELAGKKGSAPHAL